MNVAFIDLNNFKQVGDNFAHEIGDVILRSIAGVTLGLTRQSDMRARRAIDRFRSRQGRPTPPYHSSYHLPSGCFTNQRWEYQK